MEVDAGAAHRSCERDPLSPTQTQQHEAENDSSTWVHGASGRLARDVAGLECSWAPDVAGIGMQLSRG